MSEFNPYATPSSSPQDEPLDYSQRHDPRQLNFATRGERFLGSVIDTLVLIPLLVGMVVATFALPNIAIDSIWFEVIAGALTILGTILIQGYFWKTRSQSIGKIAMKTQIVDLEGVPADFHTICWKRTIPLAVVTLIPSIGSIVALVNAVMIFREQHNCLHDDIAGTRVVKLQSY